MDFTFGEKEELFRQELREWLVANVPDMPEGMEKDSPAYETYLRDWQKKMHEGRWAAIAWPEQYGGRNASLMEEIIYQQEMVRAEAPPLINYVGIHMVGPTLMDIGTEEQKSRYIEKILNGDEVWCQGYSEPNAGSDLSAIQTSAIRAEDGRWLINGQKVWTSFGHFADKCFLLARTSVHPAKRQKGITVFLLDMDQEGVEVRPIISMDGQRDFNEVYLTDAVAYDADIVGEVDEGWRVMIALLSHERTGIGGQLFALEKQFDNLIEMTKNVKKNGLSLSKDPFVRQRMAELYSRLKGSLFNYYRHLTKTLKTGYPGPEGSMDKLIVSELNKEVYSFALSLQGHAGILAGDDAVVDQKWQEGFLYSFGMTIGGGTSEIQRNTIGERILGLPKDSGR